MVKEFNKTQKMTGGYYKEVSHIFWATTLCVIGLVRLSSLITSNKPMNRPMNRAMIQTEIKAIQNKINTVLDIGTTHYHTPQTKKKETALNDLKTSLFPPKYTLYINDDLRKLVARLLVILNDTNIDEQYSWITDNKDILNRYLTIIRNNLFGGKKKELIQFLNELKTINNSPTDIMSNLNTIMNKLETGSGSGSAVSGSGSAVSGSGSAVSGAGLGPPGGQPQVKLLEGQPTFCNIPIANITVNEDSKKTLYTGQINLYNMIVNIEGIDNLSFYIINDEIITFKEDGRIILNSLVDNTEEIINITSDGNHILLTVPSTSTVPDSNICKVKASIDDITKAEEFYIFREMLLNPNYRRLLQTINRIVEKFKNVTETKNIYVNLKYEAQQDMTSAKLTMSFFEQTLPDKRYPFKNVVTDNQFVYHSRVSNSLSSVTHELKDEPIGENVIYTLTIEDEDKALFNTLTVDERQTLLNARKKLIDNDDQLYGIEIKSPNFEDINGIYDADYHNTNEPFTDGRVNEIDSFINIINPRIILVITPVSGGGGGGGGGGIAGSADGKKGMLSFIKIGSDDIKQTMCHSNIIGDITHAIDVFKNIYTYSWYKVIDDAAPERIYLTPIFLSEQEVSRADEDAKTKRDIVNLANLGPELENFGNIFSTPHGVGSGSRSGSGSGSGSRSGSGRGSRSGSGREEEEKEEEVAPIQLRVADRDKLQVGMNLRWDKSGNGLVARENILNDESKKVTIKSLVRLNTKSMVNITYNDGANQDSVHITRLYSEVSVYSNIQDIKGEVEPGNTVKIKSSNDYYFLLTADQIQKPETLNDKQIDLTSRIPPKKSGNALLVGGNPSKRKVYTGQKGGKYVMIGGKKRYLKK